MSIEPKNTPDPGFIKTMTSSQPQADAKDTDGQYDQVTVGVPTKADTKSPHQDAKDRVPGDHPHSGLARK